MGPEFGGVVASYYARYRRVLRRTTVAGNGPVIGPFSVR